MQQIELTLVLGQNAQRYHLQTGSRTLTGLVRDWQSFGPAVLPLSHPSPRNNRWLGKNPWFAAELLPQLKARINQILDGQVK